MERELPTGCPVANSFSVEEKRGRAAVSPASRPVIPGAFDFSENIQSTAPAQSGPTLRTIEDAENATWNATRASELASKVVPLTKNVWDPPDLTVMAAMSCRIHKSTQGSSLSQGVKPATFLGLRSLESRACLTSYRKSWMRFLGG
jgi:hypothetical protein